MNKKQDFLFSVIDGKWKTVKSTKDKSSLCGEIELYKRENRVWELTEGPTLVQLKELQSGILVSRGRPPSLQLFRFLPLQLQRLCYSELPQHP